MTDRNRLAVLACGHACADFCQGAIPALVPFLVLRGGMDFKATGVLLLVMSVASSLLQPLIGAHADRSGMTWAVPAGVALGGVGIAAVGVVDGFVPRVIAVAVAGLGVALFHPGAARRATRAAGDRPGSGLGVFAVGGSAGFALAPAVLTPSILVFGLSGTLVALVPALAVAALLATTSDAPPGTARRAGVLTAALALTLPAVALVGLSPSPALAFPAAALAGLVVVGGYTSTVVLGQRMLPRRETFAAGMTLGFAMGAGGLTVALLGPLADSAGPEAALWISGGLAALAVPAALKIGGRRRFAGATATG